VSVNEVERRVRKLQVIDISDGRPEIANTSLSSQPQCRRNCGWRRVDANDCAIRQPFGEIDGDRAGPDAHIE
jgi:hypothetical protein